MKDKQSSSGRNIHYLWVRGKFWEIFGFASGDFTALELARQYSALTKAYRDKPEDMRIIDGAFATLNAPLTRQFYEGCRMVMQRIQREIGDAGFISAEDRIWSDLWGWVSPRWQAPPEELISALKTKHSQPIRSTIHPTETWADERLKPAGIDSVMAAEAFAREVKCQRCGKFDHTLRVVAFPYVISIVVASFKRFDKPGILCHHCRCVKSAKWAIVSLLFGWWSIWGFFWNIAALVDNFRGGKMPRENNEPLVARLAWALMVLGRVAEAKAALRDFFGYGASEETLHLKQELDRNYPEISPATSGGFRLGYLSVVFAIMGIYVIAGIALFGGSSDTATTKPPPIQPRPATPSQTTPATTPRTTPATTPQPTPVTPPKRTPLIPPDKSFVKWDDSSGWTTKSTMTITGSVKNTHHEWSMTSVRIEVEMLDKYSKVIQRVTVNVSPSTIPPGGTGKYYQVITVDPASESGEKVIYWAWSPPR